MGGGGGGKGGSKTPQYSPEYQAYLDNWNAQNGVSTGSTKSVYGNNRTFQSNGERDYTGSDSQSSAVNYDEQGHEVRPGESDAWFYGGRNKSSLVSQQPAPKPAPTPTGEFTGTAKMSETEFYSAKYKKEQEDTQVKLQQQLDNQKKDFESQTNKLLADQENQRREQEARQLEAQRMAEEERQRQLEAQGRSRRDELYASYLDNAAGASDFVRRELEREEANAKLLGVDFMVSDEQRKGRVNDYFSTVWTQGQQQQLDELIGQYGSPANFKGFDVTRGDGSSGKYGERPGKETLVGQSRGTKAKSKTSTLLTGTDAYLGA